MLHWQITQSLQANGIGYEINKTLSCKAHFPSKAASIPKFWFDYNGNNKIFSSTSDGHLNLPSNMTIDTFTFPLFSSTNTVTIQLNAGSLPNNQYTYCQGLFNTDDNTNHLKCALPYVTLNFSTNEPYFTNNTTHPQDAETGGRINNADGVFTLDRSLFQYDPNTHWGLPMYLLTPQLSFDKDFTYTLSYQFPASWGGENLSQDRKFNAKSFFNNDCDDTLDSAYQITKTNSSNSQEDPGVDYKFFLSNVSAPSGTDLQTLLTSNQLNRIMAQNLCESFNIYAYATDFTAHPNTILNIKNM